MHAFILCYPLNSPSHLNFVISDIVSRRVVDSPPPFSTLLFNTFGLTWKSKATNLPANPRNIIFYFVPKLFWKKRDTSKIDSYDLSFWGIWCFPSFIPPILYSFAYFNFNIFVVTTLNVLVTLINKIEILFQGDVKFHLCKLRQNKPICYSPKFIRLMMRKRLNSMFKFKASEAEGRGTLRGNLIDFLLSLCVYR